MPAFASGTTLWNDSLFVKKCYELSAELPGHGCRESRCIIAGLQPVTFVLCGESCFLVFFQKRYFGFAERYYWIQELFRRNLKVCKSCASRGHACLPGSLPIVCHILPSSSMRMLLLTQSAPAAVCLRIQKLPTSLSISSLTRHNTSCQLRARGFWIAYVGCCIKHTTIQFCPTH